MDIDVDMPDAEVTDDTAEIRADIERTRADMTETIEAIQERLSPSHLKEQAQEQFQDIKEQVKEQVQEQIEEAKQQVRAQFQEAKHIVREATIGRVENMVQYAGDTVEDARSTISDTIRQNPIPAALVGIGLGWLFMNRSSTKPTRYSGRGSARGSGTYQGNQRQYDEYRVRYDDRGGYDNRAGYYNDSRMYRNEPYYNNQSSGITDRAQGAVSSAVGSVTDTASNVASSVTDTASNVASTVSETASNVASTVSETASNVVDRAQYQAQRLEDRVQSALYSNPLAVGAVTLALGTAVGLALPQTERENRLMGEARDNLVDRAQEVASDTIEMPNLQVFCL